MSCESDISVQTHFYNLPQTFEDLPDFCTASAACAGSITYEYRTLPQSQLMMYIIGDNTVKAAVTNEREELTHWKVADGDFSYGWMPGRTKLECESYNDSD